MQSVTRIIIVSILVLFVATAATSSDCPPFYIFTAEGALATFGHSVASAVAVNNDGYSDFIICALGQNSRPCRAYVLF